MFWISNKKMEILWVLALFFVIIYSFIDKWKVSFWSWEFWVLLFVLIIQIKHIIPEKLKSLCFYFYNKVISWKYFDFNLDYSFNVNSQFTNVDEIYLKLEKILNNENKTFTRNNSTFKFWDYLEIVYENNNDNNILKFNLKNDKYTIESLEKDLDYYNNIFTKIKDNLWWADKQSLSSKIKINKFYTPEYLLKKYSNWYNQLEVKINNQIILKRKLDKEELIIKSSNNLLDITDKLKNYIKLTL